MRRNILLTTLIFKNGYSIVIQASMVELQNIKQGEWYAVGCYYRK